MWYVLSESWCSEGHFGMQCVVVCGVWCCGSVAVCGSVSLSVVCVVCGLSDGMWSVWCVCWCEM